MIKLKWHKIKFENGKVKGEIPTTPSVAVALIDKGEVHIAMDTYLGELRDNFQFERFPIIDELESFECGGYIFAWADITTFEGNPINFKAFKGIVMTGMGTYGAPDKIGEYLTIVYSSNKNTQFTMIDKWNGRTFENYEVYNPMNFSSEFPETIAWAKVEYPREH